MAPDETQELHQIQPDTGPSLFEIGNVLLGLGIILVAVGEDVAIGGVRLLDDPVTIGIGVGLILGIEASGATSPSTPDGGVM